MAGQYFYARGDKHFGPYSGARLKELATNGALEPTDTVWKAGMTTSVRADTVHSLFPNGPSAAGPDDTEVAAAKVPSPVLSEPPPTAPDGRAAAAEPLQAIQTLEPPLDLVPIDEEPKPPTPTKPDAVVKPILVQSPAGEGRIPERKRRAEAVRGAIIVSQDGAIVHYRKKCSKCGHESTSKNSMPIRMGATTANFFCPKCKKLRDVVIRGNS